MGSILSNSVALFRGPNRRHLLLFQVGPETRNVDIYMYVCGTTIELPFIL